MFRRLFRDNRSGRPWCGHHVHQLVCDLDEEQAFVKACTSTIGCVERTRVANVFLRLLKREPPNVSWQAPATRCPVQTRSKEFGKCACLFDTGAPLSCESAAQDSQSLFVFRVMLAAPCDFFTGVLVQIETYLRGAASTARLGKPVTACGFRLVGVVLSRGTGCCCRRELDLCIGVFGLRWVFVDFS